MIKEYIVAITNDVNPDAFERFENEYSPEQELVRCKDCEYSEHWYGDRSRCFLWADGGISVFDNGFCNYGKRRGQKKF